MAVSKTIGAAGDFATFAAFNSTQNAGDTANFLDAIHTENVNVTKLFFLEGDRPDRGSTITSSGLTLNGTGGAPSGTRVKNLHISRTGTGITAQIAAGWTFTDVSLDSNGRSFERKKQGTG